MLAVAGLRKAFGAVEAVRGVSFAIEDGAFLSMLGPSGCGKTTTLRCIAGLERPDAGTVAVGGRTLFDADTRIDVSASERRLGMVFQSYAIWPHMTVRENVAFPLSAAPRRRRPTPPQAAERVDRALEVVRLAELGKRRATDLSGGQQQRLALARALALEPPLLLLDEPLSNLDARLREEVRAELQRIQREVGVTTLYVTHDQAEALALSDVVAVMRAGEIEQLGSPRDVYARPASEFVASFVGAANLVPGEILGRENGHVAIGTGHGELLVPQRDGAPEERRRRVQVVVRPEHVVIGPETRGGWQGLVVSSSFLGDAVEHVVAVGELTLRARGAANSTLEPGARVSVAFADGQLSLVSAEGNGTG
jgi:iron(III) transport system ATP-binding protein